MFSLRLPSKCIFLNSHIRAPFQMSLMLSVFASATMVFHAQSSGHTQVAPFQFTVMLNSVQGQTILSVSGSPS